MLVVDCAVDERMNVGSAHLKARGGLWAAGAIGGWHFCFWNILVTMRKVIYLLARKSLALL